MNPKQLTRDEVGQVWLRRLIHIRGKLPFVGATILPLILIPVVALTHGTTSSITEAFIACAIFAGFSLFVEITWLVWRRSRGHRRDKIEKDLIPLAIFHSFLVVFYFAFIFMWAILGIAEAINLSKQSILIGGVLGFLLTPVYTFIRGSYYNRLLFPDMYYDESMSSILQHPHKWRHIEPYLQMLVSIAVFLGSILSRWGGYQYAIFLIVAGYSVANLMLFFSLLILYQLAVLLFAGEGQYLS